MRVTKRIFLLPAVLVMALLSVPAASAHQSPQECSGTEPQLSFSSATVQQLDSPVRQGDQVILGARISNKGEAACDLSDVSIVVQVPKPDGGPGQKFTIASNVSLSAGAAVEGFEEAASYAVDLNMDVPEAMISMSWSATVHNGSPDSEIGGDGAEAKLTMTRPQALLSVLPNRSSGEPPLTVNYFYALRNSSPVTATGLPAPSLVPNVIGDSRGVVSDPNCSPVTFVSSVGPSLAETTLEPDETWVFTCSRTYLLPGTYNSQPSIVGTSSEDDRPWPQVPTGLQVTVLGADLIVEKTHEGDLLAGGAGEYRISVTNSGNQQTSGEVSVADQLPAGLTATSISGEGWSCSLQALSCSRSDSLAVGSSYPDVILAVKVANDPASNVVNMATVTGGVEPSAAATNNLVEDPTTIRTPGQPEPPVGRKFLIKQVTASPDGSATIKVLVPGKGTLTADDARKPDLLGRSSRKVKRARVYPIVIKAGPKLRQQLTRTSKPRKVRVKVSFSTSGSATPLVVFRGISFRLG